MSEAKVRALKYEVAEVGKHIKASKKRYFWSLSIGDRFYNFLLDDSLVSGKSKLTINGKVFHQAEENTLNRNRYNHSFIIDGCLFNITQTDNAFEMRINNKLFSHMLTQEMAQMEFKEHSVEDSSFELAGKLKQSESKKITLSLPGIGNGMKKKKSPTAQTDNWNQFAGSSGFPSFFGEAQPKECKPTASKIECKVECKVEEEKPEAIKDPTPEEFSTLQNLFKTITACGQYVPKANQAATPTYDISEIPAIPQINLEEFNTMQNLFSTINTALPLQKVEQTPKAKMEDFNTMQNLFATLKQPQEAKKQCKPEAPKPKSEDFNTMQNLFSTLKQTPPPVCLPTLPENLDKVKVNDFNTLQNLFATGFSKPVPAPSEKQPQPTEEEFYTVKCAFETNSQNKTQAIPDLSKVNLNDFNTIQNLFSTNTFAPKTDVLGSTDKANKAQSSPKKAEPVANQADFNTMQNLFATNVKKENFWQF